MLRFAAICLASLFASAVAFADCPGTYVNNAAPRVVVSDTGSRELCYSGYAAWESSFTRTPRSDSSKPTTRLLSRTTSRLNSRTLAASSSCKSARCT